MNLLEAIGTFFAVVILFCMAVTMVCIGLIVLSVTVDAVTGYDLITQVIRPFFQGLHL